MRGQVCPRCGDDVPITWDKTIDGFRGSCEDPWHAKLAAYEAPGEKWCSRNGSRAVKMHQSECYSEGYADARLEIARELEHLACGVVEEDLRMLIQKLEGE